jgi:hypothetical protein
MVLACGPNSTGEGNNNNGGACPEPGQTDCGGICVDTNTDRNHCGSCDNACDPTDVCDGQGSCTAQCQGALTNCGGFCADLQADALNCGSCGFQCASDEVCNAGECEDSACVATSSEAQIGVLPADIILVVDNSDSMTDEAGFVQASMNDFVGAIVSSGIDAHVILISADSNDSQGICVPAPVGSGSCPGDTQPPTFVHVLQEISSSNGLERVLSTYPQWSQYLRPSATKTIAIISDDDSGMSAAAFTSQIVALDPTFTDFKFDAIIPPYDYDHEDCVWCMVPAPIGPGDCTVAAGCDRCCGPDPFLSFACTAYPDGDGQVYRDLVNQTGGVEGDLCNQDFLPVFQDMATEVISGAQVSCVYDIPDPPGGEQIDYSQVNVEWISTPGATPELILNVPGGLSDCGPNGGWYYDDPAAPTQVLFCPDTCSFVETSTEGRVDVMFGCATIVQ